MSQFILLALEQKPVARPLITKRRSAHTPKQLMVSLHNPLGLQDCQSSIVMRDMGRNAANETCVCPASVRTSLRVPEVVSHVVGLAGVKVGQ